ncbi:PAS domain S-box protein [Planctomycetota bacterium]|jgi:PAS domain S-box-containing protein|nr:PAS domain S-box protein [Planctomycetota bacterium]MDC0585072.1 PAS domain S-box protein [Planctomycetota bacterium]
MATEQDRALGQDELSAILSTTMDAVIVVDELQIILFNAAAEAMFGCAESDALGSPVERFMPERYRVGHREMIQLFGERSITSRRMGELGEIWGLRANGEEFPIEASIGMVDAKGRRLLSVILRDVTARRAADSGQRESRRAYSTLLRNIPGMAYRRVNDRAWTMSFVSDGCDALTGYSAKELVEGEVAFGDLIHADDRQRVWKDVRASIAQRAQFDLNYRIHAKDGGVRWVSDKGVGSQEEGADGTHLEGIVVDVTALKMAELEIRSSEEQFRALAMNAAVALFQTDARGNVEYVNPHWCELTGLSPEEALGSGWTRAFHPEERERLASEWAEHTRIAADAVSLTLRRFVRPDGSERWAQGTAVTLRDAGGKVTGFLGTLTDVTERRQAEEKIRGRHEALKQIATGASLGEVLSALVRSAEEVFPDLRCAVLLLDKDKHRLRHCVAPSLPESYVHAFDGIEIRDNAGPLGVRQRAIVEDVSTHPSWVEHRELARQADIRACWTEPVLSADGGALGLLTMYDRKPRGPEPVELAFIETTAHLAGIAVEHDRANMLLRSSEQSLRAVFNQRTELATLVTPVGILSDANERSLAMIGADRTEVVGRPLWETPWWAHDPALQERLREAIAEASSGEIVRFEAQHPGTNGSLADIDFSLTPITNDNGAVWMLFAEGVDVSAKKKALRKLRRTERRAHEAERLASIATLAAGVAHDIGAPMTAILGYAEMMQTSLPDDKNRRRAGIIVEQLNRITELVQALLNVARPDEWETTSIDVANVIERSLDFYSEVMRERGIRVERALASVPMVNGDHNRLQQALLSLLINAADAMREGGTLRVSLSSTSDEIEVRIQDTGVGIPPDQLEKIFEPFYTTKERRQGTGLGLLVAKGIVDEHGGTISVESSPGLGATFTICLPVSEE